MKKMKLLLVVSTLFLMYCTLDKLNDPKPPKWDMEVEKIPLFKADTLRLGNELDADDFTRVGAESLLYVNQHDAKGFYLGDKLKITSQQESYADHIGEFQISGGQPINHEIQFSELYPGLSGSIGASIPIPGASIPAINRDTHFDDFVSVHIVSGGLQIDVYNHLGFVLGDNVILDLYDLSTNQRIDQVNFSRINNQQSGTYFIDLAGKTISSNLQVRIHGDLVGSEGASVLITADAGFTVTVTAQNLVADQAQAKLPPQSFVLEGGVDINSDTLNVKTASIEQGSINISIDNSFQFPIQVDITIPNIRNRSSHAVTIQLVIDPGNRYDEYVSLNNTLLDLDGKDLRFETQLSIIPDAQSYYTLSSGDELVVIIDISDIQLLEVVGDFDIKTEFPHITEKVFKDFPDELKNVSLYNAILTLNFINSPFDQMVVNINMEATKGGETRPLNIYKTIQNGGSLTLDRNGINSDQSSPTFIDIINLLPEQIDIQGNVRVTGHDISFNKNDSIGVEYTIDVPLAFTLDSTSIANQDTLKMKDKVRDQIHNYLTSASITLTIENALPLSGSLSMLVGLDSTHITDEILSVQLPQPAIDSNGRVTAPAIETLTVSLDQDKFEKLADSYFYKYEVKLDDIALARLSANDYLIVSDVFISGKMLIDPDGLSNDDDDDNDE
ncbi:hypothetical protein JW960_29370 [candidate division KSB1 bacterium]|nr:hypothetical protein [candidate division KSB1 bacterium]